MKIMHGVGLSVAIGCFMVVAGCGDMVTGFSPSSGKVGDTVTIQGTNFSTTAADNTVMFNGVTATVDSSTATSIVTTVPPGATTGHISVTANGKTGTSVGSFRVQPVLTEFLPASGIVGTAVTLSGTGFDSNAANDTVLFNGTAAVITSATSTTIVTAVPSGASTGKISVTVNGESVISTSDFTVN
jgi:hypothetical protein